MAANELVSWNHLPEDNRPQTYPGRTDVPAQQLNWHQDFRVHTGVPVVEARPEIQRAHAERKSKLQRLTVNDQVQPEVIAGTPFTTDGFESRMPGAEYEITPTTLRPEWTTQEK
jgi:hypothetical protein